MSTGYVIYLSTPLCLWGDQPGVKLHENGRVALISKNRFYIVDWKSNTLDCRAGNFTGKALKDAMFQATYPMQYLCYLAALMRYLEQRTGRTFDRDLYDKYIGGVYYIFLRGITLGSDHGIFSARPDFETIRQLADSLSGSASTTPGA